MKLETLEDYRRAIAREETAMLEAKQRLAELRRQAPREEFEDYALKAWDGGEVRLSELFGGREDLIVIHNMGRGCAYCTMWADGFNGVVPHLEDRAAFVVVSPDPPDVQRDFATGRGWRFRMASAHGSSFLAASGFVAPEGPSPGVSTFRKDPDGRIHRVSKAEIQPGDDFCSVWHLFDLLADGPVGWEPKVRYPGRD